MKYKLNTKVPCMILRGGTSKGVFFLEKDVPPIGEQRDAFLLNIMGSPDLKQINGLGGAASVTSKVAIISISNRSDADIDYTFAQVSVDKPLVSYKGNCGNISSAVGPFAIEKGLVSVTEPTTSVRIYNTNTDKIIVADVQTENRAVKYEGEFVIAGVPGTAAPIKLNFINPSGTISDKLLPTGNVTDELTIPGYGNVTVSIVDAANPLVFIKAKDIGLIGTELPKDLDVDEDMLKLLENIRGMAAVKLGLIEDYSTSAWTTPGIPKMTIVSEACDYIATSGKEVTNKEVDLLSRMMSMQKTHPTYAMTGAMCTAAACVIPGTVVNQVVSKDVDTQFIRIGHPSGIMEAGVDYNEDEDSNIAVSNAFGFRTANILLEGLVYC